MSHDEESALRIECVEIQNYRKLASVRVDLASETTLLVGANNSGKTSALIAMRAFLAGDANTFRLEDVTLSGWSELEAIGERATREQLDEDEAATLLRDFRRVLPSMDIWFEVSASESHLVGDLIPTLDWSGGRVGVRVSLEPRSIRELATDYGEARDRRATLDPSTAPSTAEAEESPAPEGPPTSPVSAATDGVAMQPVVPEAVPSIPQRSGESFPIWPGSFVEFLRRRLARHVTFRYYVLDPDKLAPTEDGLALPQDLDELATEIDASRLRDLVRVDEIGAQRGLSESRARSNPLASSAETSRLSRQLSEYYLRHLDPTDSPDASDVEALRTIAQAQVEFDKRLAEAFAGALGEMQNLGYPGVTDPRILVASRLTPMDSLLHDSAVSFLVDDASGEAGASVRLPEGHSGLGYQNLISIVFQLMGFRDQWLGVGKARRGSRGNEIEPIHLVLVEEPEAHLHVQVQQVFAKKAYEVLRNNPILQEEHAPTSQLVISTHSSHIAHEMPFANLRYFRRLPAGTQRTVPTAGVASLGGVFGTEIATKSFVTRYLRAQHSDLFFADAIILVEGPAERMLVPNFIRVSFPALDSSYVSVLEIGGSHAHRLRPLIVALRVPTLVITDIDAGAAGKSAPVERGAGQQTTNPSLKEWLAADGSIDLLLDAGSDEKLADLTDTSAVRFAYQVPVEVDLSGDGPMEVLPSTFEDALVADNPDFFRTLDGAGLTKRVRDALATNMTAPELMVTLFESLKDAKKAEFALDVLGSESFESVKTPGYISEGLRWLESKVIKVVVETGSAEV
jgi:predicted ATP-dependent endonuclease of OLD family